jgi:hypothetical protein
VTAITIPGVLVATNADPPATWCRHVPKVARTAVALFAAIANIGPVACPVKRADRAVNNETVPEAPSAFAQATRTEEMSLLDRIGLLERTEWTPEVCVCCRKQNPRHTELECPVYEKCDRCGGSGPYGYKRRHTCYPTPNEDEVSLVDYDNADYDLYWADDQEHDY